MEAVPRLPMLSFELKSSPENTEFSSKLKKYISEYYNEDADSYQQEIRELESLRYAAIHVSRDYTGCSTLKKYYSQLHLLQRRFPMTDDGVACVPFMWSDIYSGLVFNITDIKYEQACILYNIGALHSDLGAMDSRQTSDGMKISCTHFQCATWAFQYLRDNFPQPKGSDMSHDLLTFFINVMLAQAQECILEKSMLDNRKSTIIAKVAAQIADYYRQAQKTLELGSKNSESGCISEIVGSKLFKSWQRYVQFKILYHTCTTYLYLGNQAEEQQKMGERLGYFQAALDKLNEAIKLSKHLDKEALAEALTFTMDVVGGKYDAAKKENDFIYHEKVLDVDSLPEIKGASLVKGIPFHPTDPEVSGPDIFSRLVPMETHEASSLYSEEKAKILRRVTANIEERNQELELYMASLQLDNLKLTSEPDQLPQELIECCAALSVKPDVIKDLVSAMQTLSGVYHDVESSLQEIEAVIAEDEEKENELKETIGHRGPSMILLELKKELSKYKEAHNKASESNNALHKAMNVNLANLKLLSSPLEKLQEVIPSVGILDAPNDEGVVSHLKHLLSKVDDMKNQRHMFENQLRVLIQKDDITKQLVAHGEDNIQELFDRELKKYQQLITLLDQNLAAQDNILRALTDANAQYADVRKANNDLFQKRNSTIQSLISSFEIYEDLIAKSNKGYEFYKKLEANVNKLLQRTKSVCKVQEEERQQLLGKNNEKTMKNAKPATAAVPTGLTLKDYLPFVQNRRKHSQISAIPTQDPLDSSSVSNTSQPQAFSGISSDSVYLPRPAPVGSEHTDVTQDHNITPSYQADPKTLNYDQIIQPPYYYQTPHPTSTPPSLPTTSTLPSTAPQPSFPPNAYYQKPPDTFPDTRYSHEQPAGPAYQQYNSGYYTQPINSLGLQYNPESYYQLPQQSATYNQPAQNPVASKAFPTSAVDHTHNQAVTIPKSISNAASYNANSGSESPLQYTQAGMRQAETMVSSRYNPYASNTGWANNQEPILFAPPAGQPLVYYPASVSQAVSTYADTSSFSQAQGYAPNTGAAATNYQTPSTPGSSSGNVNRLPSGADGLQYTNQTYGYYQQDSQANSVAASFYSAPYTSQGYTIPPEPKNSNIIGNAYTSNSNVATYAYSRGSNFTNYSYTDSTSNSYTPSACIAANTHALSNNASSNLYTSTSTAFAYNEPQNNASMISSAAPASATNYSFYQDAPVLIPQKPLVPETVKPTQQKSTVPQLITGKTGTNLKLLEELSSVSNNESKAVDQGSRKETLDKKLEERKTVEKELIVDQGKLSATVKDPYSDPEVLSRFLADVDRLEKLTEGLIKQLLNGPTLLEQKWKELNDTQEREGRKLAISVARCYSMKNRLADVMPYDNNRVLLAAGKDDYINASLFKNLSQSSLQFIATQCPLPSTFSDFWLMAYEQQSELIVCLISDAEIKQNVYWPNEKNQTLLHGSINVGLQSTKTKSWGVERIITLTHQQNRITRVVIHLQCVIWPPSENPGNLRNFLDFLGDSHSYYLQQRCLSRPLIVHCSAGVGRTGVYCLILSALQDIKFGRGILDVTSVASQMTLMRKSVFQDKDQIRFCYEAILYHARDILMKRGILSSKPTFDEKLPTTPKSSHTRHPSQDFILGNLQLSATNSSSDKVDTSAPEVSPTHVANKERSNPSASETETQVAPEGERSRSNSVASVASLSSLSSTDSTNKAKNTNLPPSLANLDATNFSLDPLPHKSKRKITRDSFLHPPGTGLNQATSDLLDPLSQLDPLWTHKKES